MFCQFFVQRVNGWFVWADFVVPISFCILAVCYIVRLPFVLLSILFTKAAETSIYLLSFCLCILSSSFPCSLTCFKCVCDLLQQKSVMPSQSVSRLSSLNRTRHTHTIFSFFSLLFCLLYLELKSHADQ